MEGEPRDFDYAMLYAQCLTAAASYFGSGGSGSQEQVAETAEVWFERSLSIGLAKALKEDHIRRGLRDRGEPVTRHGH